MLKIVKTKNSKTIYLFNKKILRFGTQSPKALVKDIKREVQGLENLIHTAITASNLPQAQGVLRNIQCAELKILKEIDRVCKDCQMTYWLDYGTLLGAIRHQGFIPWDDDIDIVMLRKDYENFIEEFNRHTQDKNLQAVLYTNPSNSIYNLIKVIHKEIPEIWVDVFVADFYYQKMDDQQKQEFSRELVKKQEKHLQNRKKYTSIAAWHESFNELRKKYLEVPQENSQNPSVFYGLEFRHNPQMGYVIFDYDMIFPLGQIRFEGETFPTVAKPHEYLTYVYGDYLSLPYSLHTHTDMNEISAPDMLKIENYAKK